MYDRVKYFPSNDLCFGRNLSKIETLQIPSIETINVNDAIEFSHIKKYFDVGTHAKTWSDEEYNTYKLKSDKLFGLTKHFFNQITDSNILDIYNGVILGYHSEFWVLFDNCKLYNKISESVFKLLIKSEHVYPKDLFLHRNIVFKYGEVLRDFILTEKSILILLHVYEQDYTCDEKLMLPKELTSKDICKCIEDYIEEECPDISNLSKITNMHATSQFMITDKIRLKAKRRYETEVEKISKKGVSISSEIRLTINSKQREEKRYNTSDNKFEISYSKNWLMETLDYPSVLNNFIFVFEFVDYPQMRSIHVNKVSQSRSFEKIMMVKSSRYYPHNVAFDFSQQLASIQMQAYYEFLGKQQIYLENIIEWFFMEYLQAEFGCAEIRLSMPTINSSYLEKCSSIITAFESILKQYNLYVKNGEVDFDLVQMSTTPISFEAVESLIADKYIYGVGDEFEGLSFQLFSDQCLLSYVERIEAENRRYNCLVDLLVNEDVYLSDYREEEQKIFEKIAEYNLISFDDEKIILQDKMKIMILKDLFENGVISQKHYPSNANSAFCDFIEKGIVETKSTLFSQLEIDYLNYLLNRASYNNGLEIRNKYMHGIQQTNKNEEEHRQNYFILLRVFILLVIKINDEFCLKDKETEEKSHEL